MAAGVPAPLEPIESDRFPVGPPDSPRAPGFPDARRIPIHDPAAAAGSGRTGPAVPS